MLQGTGLPSPFSGHPDIVLFLSHASLISRGRVGIKEGTYLARTKYSARPKYLARSESDQAAVSVEAAVCRAVALEASLQLGPAY